jgi:hypothetical protein
MDLFGDLLLLGIFQEQRRARAEAKNQAETQARLNAQTEAQYQARVLAWARAEFEATVNDAFAEVSSNTDYLGKVLTRRTAELLGREPTPGEIECMGKTATAVSETLSQAIGLALRRAIDRRLGAPPPHPWV